MANLHLSYEEFKAFYGDLGITYWTKYNYLDLDYVGKYNIWDEDWERGSINGATGEPAYSYTQIRSKNYINCEPNKKYFLYCAKLIDLGAAYVGIAFYGENKQFLGLGNGNNASFITPDNCVFFKFWTASDYGGTYLDDIRINQPILELSKINLGECSWSYASGGATRFVSSSISASVKKPESNATSAFIFCEGYENGSASSVYSGTKDIAISTAGDIWLLGTLFDTIDPTELPSILYNQFLVYEES